MGFWVEVKDFETVLVTLIVFIRVYSNFLQIIPLIAVTRGCYDRVVGLFMHRYALFFVPHFHPEVHTVH